MPQDNRELLELRATVTVMRFLENVKWSGGRQPWQTTEQVLRSVKACFSAAPLNPLFGSRDVCAVRLISAAYHESGFKFDEWRKNRNGSHDAGMLQVNSVHWTKHDYQKNSTWDSWCESRGEDKELRRLFIPDQVKLYKMLCKEVLR